MRGAKTFSLKVAFMLLVGVAIGFGHSGPSDLWAQDSTQSAWPGKPIEATGWVVKFDAQSPSGQMLASEATSGGQLNPVAARMLSNYAADGTNLPLVATGITSSRAVVYAINEDELVRMTQERLAAIAGIGMVLHYHPSPVIIGSRTFERLPQFTLTFRRDDPRTETLETLEDSPTPIVRKEIEKLGNALSRDSGIPLVAQMGDDPASLKIMFLIDQLANEVGEKLKALPGVTYIQPTNIAVSPFAG